MSNEPLGIVDALQARRVQYARFIRPLDRVAAKTHTITVDLKAGTRIVDSGAPPPPPPPVADKPRKRVKRRLDPDDLPPTKNRKILASRYSVRQVLEAVAEAYQLPVYALVSVTRSQRVARPRFAAALLLREKRFMSHTRIGHSLGKRDHTTVLYEVRRAKILRQTDLQWAADYRAAEHALCRP